MSTLGRLLVSLGLDAADYQQGLDAASADAENFGTKLNSFIGTGAALAATTAVAGIAAIGKASFDLANDVQNNQNDITANLGVTADRAAELGALGVDIWKNNWGNNIQEVNAAIIETQKQFKGLGGIADSETNKIVTSAIAIRDTFGIEINDSISAQRTLMEQFGLTGQQAADFITKGMQEGLNSSGDFLETIGEYSNLFAQGGAKAENFFSLMQTGLGSGVLGTDKAADAFKEFSVRIQDGSDTTAQGLKDLGLNVTDITQKLNSGELTKADVFGMVIDGIANADNATAAYQTGVALLGTQFEDLGPAMIANIDMGVTSLDDMAGATDTLNAKYANWPSLWEGAKRMALAALLPLGEKLLEITNGIMPQVQTTLAWLGERLPGLIDQGIVAFDNFLATLTNIWNIIQPFAASINGDVIPAIAGIVAAFAGFSIISTVVGLIGSITTAFAGLGTGATILGTIVGILGGPVTLAIGAVALAVGVLTAAWIGNWGDIQGKVGAVWNFIEPIFNTAKDWLADKLTRALSTLSDYWTNTLLPAIRIVGSFIADTLIPIAGTLIEKYIKVMTNVVRLLGEVWSNVLQPALAIVGDYIGNKLQPVFQSIANFINDKVMPVVNDLAEQMSGPLASAGNTVQGIFDAVGGAISSVGEAISGVISWVGKFIDKLDTVHVPAILEQHSPSMLEQALIDVNAQLSTGVQVAPDYNQALNRVSMPNVEGANTGGAMINVNIDARGAQRGVKEEIAAALETFAQRLGQDSVLRIRTGNI